MTDGDGRRVTSVARGLEDGTPGNSAARTPGPLQRALDPFIGRWINVGETTAGAGTAAQPIVTSDVYEWAPGGFFVIHSAYGRIGDNDVGGVEVIGYDETTSAYRSRFFDSFGNESLSRLTVADGIWTWQGEATRATATFDEGGRVQRARHERTNDGATWEPSMEVTLRKIA